MGVLHKYVFKQVFFAMLMTLALFVFVLVVGNVVKEVLIHLSSGRMSFTFFIQILLLLIPSVVPYALPMSILTAILLVFGRMSAQSEITAIKASGLSLFYMASSVFFLAMVMTIVSVGINFYYAPVANSTYKSALKNLIRNNPLQFIQPGTFIKDFPGYVIYANDSEGGELLGFRIWELNNQGQVKIAISADKGTLSYNEESEEIWLTLTNASAEKRKDNDAEDFTKPLPVFRSEEILIKLPLNKIMGGVNRQKTKLSQMTFGELLALRKDHINNEAFDKETRFRKQIEVQLQIQKNFAMAFSVFSLVVLAIPLGIKASRSETLANAGIAIALAMSYYMLIVCISWLEKIPQTRPDLLVWIPNIIFQILGIYLLLKANRK